MELKQQFKKLLHFMHSRQGYRWETYFGGTMSHYDVGRLDSKSSTNKHLVYFSHPIIALNPFFSKTDGLNKSRPEEC